MLRPGPEPKHIFWGNLSGQDFLMRLHISQSLDHLQVFFVDFKYFALSKSQVAIRNGFHALNDSAWHLYRLCGPVVIGLLLFAIWQLHKG